jgi:glycosyltransferase involved in cell wall biosynthesis
MKLEFLVPTWNRPKQLEVCIESIASQVRPDDDVLVTVLDDASDDPDVAKTLDLMCEKYQCVDAISREVHGDYSDAFRAMYRHGADADWVWTFGDDDLLRPNAMRFVLDELLPGRMDSRDFLHIAEDTRSSGAKAIIGADSLLELCSAFGWIEMTGFITGNLCRGSQFAKIAETPNWKKYAKSAFVQSAAILEALRDRPAAFVDIPLDRHAEERKLR